MRFSPLIFFAFGVCSAETLRKPQDSARDLAAADGKGCLLSSQCASGRCDWPSYFDLTPVCLAKLGLGERCNEDSDCQSGLCDTKEAFNFFPTCLDSMCGGASGFLSQTMSETAINALGSDMSPRTIEILKELDFTTLLLLGSGVRSLRKQQDETNTHTDITTEKVGLGWTNLGGSGFSGPWKKANPPTTEEPVTDTFSVLHLDEDEFFGGKDVLKYLAVNKILSTDIVDTTIYFESEEEVETLRKDIGLNSQAEGGIFPISYNSDFEKATDEEFSRLFFYGMGIPLLAAQEEVSDSDYGPFVVDMPFDHLGTRERYRPYGARVHFNQDQQVTAIYDYHEKTEHLPGDEGWEVAKYLARLTATFLVTAREHLLWTHLFVAQPVTVASTLELAPNHPIRRLLTVFTYGTQKVNADAFIGLIPEKSFLHRRSGFTYESLQEIFQFSRDTSDIFKPFKKRAVNPALQALVDAGLFPFISQGLLYYKVVESFVLHWLSAAGDLAKDDQALAFYESVKQSSMGQKYEIPEYTGDESMIDLITQAIFVVTAYHELVGYVRDVTEPSVSTGRISDCDGTQNDVQSFLFVMFTNASTSLRFPFLMQEYPNYFGSGGAPAWERTLWDSFVVDLETISEQVQEADTSRIEAGHPEFKFMDPARFECSVSV